MPARDAQLSFVIRTHGGRRDGAGRKPSGPRRTVPHRPRPAHDARHPVHVTMRADARALATPREVRRALVYILQNWRKHGRAVRGGDPCSSAGSFDGWRQRPADLVRQTALATAHTWLGRWGWRRRGLIDLREKPRAG